ncbi:Polysaccharide pyruvyl transferase [Candidatus Methanoperedens nitroreducens]|uniref:Polysaccharide pyruvyl transferase n=1 Tax=Candidatus Methanoperedens nitratireducens TaxID=1392998 RepID=A0A062V343_9EURY|nr:polysaccharide pyruvyl transferase family protein [Candidatus Methanoperedens nitroreducens]KCZ71782.1 Polysaccharide pyruvyl transferase [Candidatus Methanoperedens nitroreducens]MDJ1422244.1 polysaccharide pyruvyl transferase family protein [Candidatus Methanoperedens sp.]
MSRLTASIKKSDLRKKKEADIIRAYWWSGERNRNFGDALSPYLVEKISHKKPVLCSKHCSKEYYIVTGSVIGAANKNAIIWGAGILYRYEKIKKPKKIFAVRGPLTRKRLLESGYECPEVYGDPALLLPRLYTPKTKKQYDLGIIPHYVDYNRVKNEIDTGDALIINLLDPIEQVIDSVYSCKRTVSSSLHGIITSHTYGVPSVWVEFSNRLVGDGTKFNDYFLSVNIEPYKPFNFKNQIPSTDELISIADKGTNELCIDLDKLMDSCPFK